MFFLEYFSFGQLNTPHILDLNSDRLAFFSTSFYVSPRGGPVRFSMFSKIPPLENDNFFGGEIFNPIAHC